MQDCGTRRGLARRSGNPVHRAQSVMQQGFARNGARARAWREAREKRTGTAPGGLAPELARHPAPLRAA